MTSRSKIYSIAAFTTLLAVGSIATLATSHHSAKAVKPTTTHSASPTPVSLPASALNNYPPSRFQSGRPSAVHGLSYDTSEAANQKVTFTWNANPASENVDEYALYYLEPHYFNLPNYSLGEVAILAAVVKNNSITSTLIADTETMSFYPYGQNSIPVCTLNDGCIENPVEITVWVIAHNKHGWGDNSPKTPNPDENPVTFVPLSINQTKQQVPPEPKVIPLGAVDDPLYVTDWPAYTPDKNTEVDSLTSEALINSPWIVPWVPLGLQPESRFGPGRPSSVKNLRAISMDAGKKFISFAWSPNPVAEKVDKYAIYISSSWCPDDQCGLFLLNVQANSSFIRTLNLGGESGFNLVYANAYRAIDSEFSSPGKTLDLNTGRDYGFWVIAHNKYGWSDNEVYTPNPDQLNGDFRKLNSLERSKTNDSGATVGLSIPCTVDQHNNHLFGC